VVYTESQAPLRSDASLGLNTLHPDRTATAPPPPPPRSALQREDPPTGSTADGRPLTRPLPPAAPRAPAARRSPPSTPSPPATAAWAAAAPVMMGCVCVCRFGWWREWLGGWRYEYWVHLKHIMLFWLTSRAPSFESRSLSPTHLLEDEGARRSRRDPAARFYLRLQLPWLPRQRP